MVDGMSFILSHAKKSCFTYREGEKEREYESPMKPMEQADDAIVDEKSDTVSQFSIGSPGQKDKLLVSIGSGVSMLRVSSSGDKFERVSGTMIGGGTLVGLSNLLTGVNDFDEIIKLSQEGNNGEVDMLIKDIYGE